jgi:hypothetical protein
MTLPAYPITRYSYRRAKKLGVTIRQSTNPLKKIDVFKGDQKVASVGARGMNDYPTYMKTRGNTYAKTRRRLYRIRHRRDSTRKNTPGWYANKILW